MLKRLELVGFKSFADKTQFDFPAGITGIVGPNGSGKSNIVDAVRWVLGEQSAKSLRGGEMADVIFNGSTSRRSLGLAEVTMTFDNQRRSLVTDAEEVQITRRVYRDGQGEYLINHQPSRLRDIKELFLGSGAGTEAYSIIQQGEVDVLLQASTKDRRGIFEEAAGISRFKAKKVETLRKLERVDQNLERLRDIVDEVEKQLRSVKLQAAKAQRYQEYSDRLKELRLALGLQEYHQLAERLHTETVALEALRATLEEKAFQAATWEADLQRLETAIASLDAALHDQEASLAAARQEIATEENTLNHEWSLSTELEADVAQTRTRLNELNSRIAALASSATAAAHEWQSVERQCQEQRKGVHGLEDEVQKAILRLRQLQIQVQADKNEHLETMRRAARLQNDTVSYKAQVDNLRREHERLLVRAEQAVESLASLDIELEALTSADEALQAKLAAAREKQSNEKQSRDQLREKIEAITQFAANLKAEKSGLASRIDVLEGLERSQEGLGTGVRDVLAIVKRSEPGPWRTVIGMTADLLTVRREYAHLIDLSLAERAQRFLVRDEAELAVALGQRGEPISGRVSFVPLLSVKGVSNRESELPSHSGIVIAAADVVSCEKPELADLPRQLLGNTIIVRDLDTARALLAQFKGFRYVTLQGELLETDGTLTVGIHHAETGILSRKSELRELRQQATELDRRLKETEKEWAELRNKLHILENHAETLQLEIDVLNEQATDLRSRLTQHREKRAGLHEEVQLSRSEIGTIAQDVQKLDQQWQQAASQAEAADKLAQGLQAKLDQAETEIREKEEGRQLRQQEFTAAKVNLAQSEERLAALKATQRQLEADLEQRRQEGTEGERRLANARHRLEESQRTMLHASSVLASAYVAKEAAERQLGTLHADRDIRRHERQALDEQVHAARSAWQAEQEQTHARELALSDLRHRRETLVERLREDYQIDLAQMHEEKVANGELTTGTPGDPAAANEEIADLRKKLARLGSVNLDSLQELNELELRSTTLHVQFDDLSAAKKELEEIIAKINVDSRKLFIDTFNTIRTHFRELFRKLFGGGMADIVLEDENDILECGIEIVAQPPGKELRSISLMSGGEKTMTAVALLLAIFRSKPSPFCILDEVDAALDEANIGRFIAVLREFLDQSQFILITHSKRTMTVADVLYGITMQESGISKRVAVRFEDWEDSEANGILEFASAERNGQ